jgi:hypothetical protein
MSRTFCLVVSLAAASLISQAQPLGRGFTTDFSNCTEFVGGGR